MSVALSAVQLVIAIVLIAVLLFQARGGGVSGIFGGWGGGTFRTRRGIEKTLFRLTIVLAVLFVILAALAPWLAG